MKDSDLGVLEFDLSSDSKPIYNDYYPVASLSASEDLMIDLDFTDNEIFLTTNDGVYRADINSNLKKI